MQFKIYIYISLNLFFTHFKIVVSIILVLIWFTSCKKDDVSAPLQTSKQANAQSGVHVTKYFNLLCTITKSTSGFFLPQAARAYRYAGIINYEAVANGFENAQSLGGQLNGLSFTDLPHKTAGLSYNWTVSF